MVREYTKSELKWIKEFKALMRRSPKNLELIVAYGVIDVYESGSYNKHIGSEFDGYGMGSNPHISCCLIESLKSGCLVPYSEGC